MDLSTRTDDPKQAGWLALSELVRAEEGRAYTKLELVAMLLKTEAGEKIRSSEELADVVTAVACTERLNLLGA